MLKKLKLLEFTVFSDCDFRFSPGLNVIVGENGSGKTHLLKVMYSIISTSYAGSRSKYSEPTKAYLQTALADKLMNVFRPETLGRLARRSQGRKRSEINCQFKEKGLNIQFSFATNSKTEVTIDKLPTKWHEEAPAFLPPRELLSIYPGFVSFYEGHHIDYEETYRDTCVLLGMPALKGPRAKIINTVLSPLEEAMGGKIELNKNGRFYLHLSGGNMEMPLVAEGLRKLAMLSQLILNGSLPEQGYLFWDEPEANLNPRLIRVVARTISQLSSSGIQVFIATHSLFLLRELEVISMEKKDIENSYFSLKVSENGVEVSQGHSIDEIEPLVMLDEQLEQVDRYVELEDSQF